jgi:cyclase
LEFKDDSKKKFFQELLNISKNSYVPLTVGGGIRSLKDIEILLKNGADKIILNTASLKDPKIIQLAAKEFGSQCVVVSVDAKLKNDDFFLMEKYGKQESKHNLIDYIKEIQDNNVGEIFLQSVDNDGSLLGYDFNLLKKIESHIKVPLIISCGAGNWSHVEEALKKDIVSAASLTNIFHFTEKSIKNLKNNLKETILIRT